MISQGWINKRKELLSLSAPGPGRDAIAAEIAEAEVQLAREQGELAECIRAGFKRNEHGTKSKISGEPVDALAGFIRKEGGRWVGYSWAEALAIARG